VNGQMVIRLEIKGFNKRNLFFCASERAGNCCKSAFGFLPFLQTSVQCTFNEQLNYNPSIIGDICKEL